LLYGQKINHHDEAVDDSVDEVLLTLSDEEEINQM
jgi:hypothetical protein